MKTQLDLQSCTERPFPSKDGDADVEIQSKAPAKLPDDGTESFLKKIQNYLSQFPKLRMSWLNIFITFLFRKKTNVGFKKERLFKKAFKKVERDLDVMQILNKVKEVDRLKNYLFDENQKVIFEFFPKEIIRLKPPKSTERRKKSKTQIRKSKDFKKKIKSEYLRKLAATEENIEKGPLALYLELFKAYQKAIQSEDTPDRSNMKLISLLGDKILNIIKKGEIDM